MKYRVLFFTLIVNISLCNHSLAQTPQQSIVVQVNQPKADIQPTMWGIFFEDINFGADGGIYAELVKNRSFEFSMPLMGWKEDKSSDASGNILILNRGNKNSSNPRFGRTSLQLLTLSFQLL